MTRPDSPCIAVCDVLYKDICSGCGRTYVEVAQWNAMSINDREAVWQRIDTEAVAWRYNRYKERVKDNEDPAHCPPDRPL